MTKMKISIAILLLVALTFSACSNDDDNPCTESTWYEDADHDGFGNLSVFQESCTQPNGFVSNADDVDDTDANLNPNTVWQGSKITFTKPDNADWTQEANQDRITNTIWITRANNQGIFNIASETSYSAASSPADTEWAIGTTENIGSLNFQNWREMSGNNPPSLVDQNVVVHLITDNIYIDLKFTSWTGGGAGGGFSYERSTMN